jgi:hypothetical protein
MHLRRKLFGASAKPTPPPKGLKDLPSHVRVEPPSCWSITRDKDAADGVWFRSCGTEHTLIHYGGWNPFGYVVCRVCSRPFSRERCVSYAILTPTSKNSALDTTVKHPETSDHYGRICRTCGLSHRMGAPRFPNRCTCGAHATNKDTVFYIGSVDSYRRNPNAVATSIEMNRVTRVHDFSRPAAPVDARMFKVATETPLQRRNAVRVPAAQRPPVQSSTQPESTQ